MNIPDFSTTSFAGPASAAALRRGFTLIELLIAIALSSVVIISSYFMFVSSSELFNHQDMVVDNQNSLRFSLSTMRNDIAKAGHQLSPNPGFDPMVCPTPTTALNTIRLVPGSITDVEQQIDYTGIYIAGDLSGFPEPARVLSINGGVVAYAPIGVTPEAAAEAFRPPALAGIRNPDGVAQYVPVALSEPGVLTLAFPPAQALGGSCGASAMAAENHELMPITGVLYKLERDTSTVNKVDLVRWRIDPINALAITDPAGNNSARTVVSEWAVGLRFSILGTSGLPGVNTVAFENPSELFDFDGELNSPNLELTPQRARFVLFRVQTATRRAVPRRLAMPSVSFDPTASEPGFYPLGQGRFAEIRTLQGRIELINFSLRNMP